ncbi:L,D-transpeptidase family protein [Streptomyces sp. NPDC026673]|uniref:L,D-transpeptidase family protein n=1 Tax=Streptomyces sp. NPDC026673 TaxID=3155724 RepID=UPI00340A442B
MSMPAFRRRGGVLSGISVAVATAGVLAGCAPAATVAGAPRAAAAAPSLAAPAAAAPSPEATPEPAVPTLPDEVPGLGRRTLAAIPDDARQVVVVTGDGRNSSRSRVVVHERTPEGWRGGASWPARNAQRGWTRDHHGGDRRSPIGVFGLTDAGGLKADPGTRLPYDRSGGFRIVGTGLEGEPLEGSFDYVVAIDYNRKPGTSPLDWTRPMGAAKGGGIWFHVDHGGPTHGCVGLSKAHMRQLLRTLDPDLHPVVVMGDAASLSR